MTRLFFSLLLLLPFNLTHAETGSAPASSPAMITITPPELPKAVSLKEELKRDSRPAPSTDKPSYFLSDPNDAAYLEFKQDDTSPTLHAPQWELFRWESSTDNQ